MRFDKRCVRDYPLYFVSPRHSNSYSEKVRSDEKNHNDNLIQDDENSSTSSSNQVETPPEEENKLSIKQKIAAFLTSRTLAMILSAMTWLFLCLTNYLKPLMLFVKDNIGYITLIIPVLFFFIPKKPAKVLATVLNPLLTLSLLVVLINANAPDFFTKIYESMDTAHSYAGEHTAAWQAPAQDEANLLNLNEWLVAQDNNTSFQNNKESLTTLLDNFVVATVRVKDVYQPKDDYLGQGYAALCYTSLLESDVVIFFPVSLVEANQIKVGDKLKLVGKLQKFKQEGDWWQLTLRGATFKTLPPEEKG